MTSASDPAAAARQERFEVLGKLGSGGMGVVYRVRDTRLGREVALKVLRTVSGPALYRFKREFRALADVTHPNLVGLRTLESDGGQWFITLDLLDGCDFLNFVRHAGRSPRDFQNLGRAERRRLGGSREDEQSGTEGGS